MIKRFSVQNYKGFKDKIEFNLETNHDYKFHQEAVSDSICKKVLVFGRNGTGKSNLGCAIMDIIIHLTNKYRIYSGTYTNLNSEPGVPAIFEYTFSLNGHDVFYTYKKINPLSLIEESLFIDGKEVVFANYLTKEKRCNLEEANDLDLQQYNFGLSFVAFIHSRIDYTLNTTFNDFYKFVDNMLSFRSLRTNQFEGFQESGNTFADIIIENGGEPTLKKLEEFIYEKTGIKYNLFIDYGPNRTQKIIYARFKKGVVPLDAISSTGTSSLVLFFCWMIKLDSVSFLYLDEFDAFYHYELSEEVLKVVQNNDKFQSVVTTHNCGLMSNKLTRPDCCFIISNNQIKKIIDCTDREIREGHNLENLYKNGAFCE